MQNSQRWVNIWFTALAVVAWFLVRQLTDVLWGMLRLPLPQDWPVTPADLIGAVLAVAMFVLLKRNQRVNVFFNEVVTELAKVTWPPRKETILSAGVVSVMISICALLLFAIDTVWGTVVKVLYQ